MYVVRQATETSSKGSLCSGRELNLGRPEYAAVDHDVLSQFLQTQYCAALRILVCFTVFLNRKLIYLNVCIGKLARKSVFDEVPSVPSDV